MIKSRYILLSIAACVIVSLGACDSNIQSTQTPTTSVVTQASNHNSHGNKGKININNAILSELDKLEAKLGVPALSNQIQGSRPYSSAEDLVIKKVITQEQFEQIKDMVTVEEVILTGEAKDVDYMIKLALMKGHLLVAQELLAQNQTKQAKPHIGHPLEEIYVDIEEQLNERKVKEFKTDLVNLNNLVESDPKDSKIKDNLIGSISNVDLAIAALPIEERAKPEFVLKVINGLLSAANAEYEAAVAKNKITEPIEYQDSRGFVVYSHELYQGISGQMTTVNQEAHKAIDKALTELLKVWPAVIPPAQAIKTSEDVTKIINIIEENTEKVLSQTNTKVQN